MASLPQPLEPDAGGDEAVSFAAPVVPTPPAAPAYWPSTDVRHGLAQLAAGLDARFLRCGELLGGAIAILQGMLGGLDGLATTLGKDKAGHAVAGLRNVARLIEEMPLAMQRRDDELEQVAKLVTALRGQAGEIERALLVLGIYGMNIKIAGVVGDFRIFVDEMDQRLSAGKTEIDTLSQMLGMIGEGVQQIRRADAGLIAMQRRTGPAAARRIEDCAERLSAHLDAVAVMARDMSRIGHIVEQSVGAVLAAIQVADCARQRIEHIVAALDMIESERTSQSGAVPPAALGHVARLIAAQVAAADRALSGEIGHLEEALGQLAATGSELARLGDGVIARDGEASLRDLDASVVASRDMATQLCDATARSAAMAGSISDTVDFLTQGLDAIEQIVLDVRLIAVNTRLLCARHGEAGNAVAVIAVEVAAQAKVMQTSAQQVVGTIADLGVLNRTLHDEALAVMEEDPVMILDEAEAAIAAACRQSDEAIREGNANARTVRDRLDAATVAAQGEDTGHALGQAAEALARVPDFPLDEPASEWLRAMLPRIAALYTMAAEREVHGAFVIPGMAEPARPVVVEQESSTDDDGFF